MGRIVERHWRCDECGEVILGRHKHCPNDGAPREKGEMLSMDELDRFNASGQNVAPTVTDPKLLELARAGADWFCTHCGSGNRGDADDCKSCGAPRYGKAEENHPKFSNDHKDVVGFDERLEAEMDGGWASDPPEYVDDLPYDDPMPQPFPDSPFPPPPREQEPDPVDEWDRVKSAGMFAGASGMLTMLGGGAAFLSVLAFLIWAFQTHETEGTVSQMTWEHSTIRQHWTTFTVRKWEDETLTRREREPVNGTGERAGMKHAGNCREEHHHYEQYVCGSHQECTDIMGSEDYSCTKTRTITSASQCGETCRDLGNGFSDCSPNSCTESYQGTCTRRVKVGEDCKMVDDYCDRSIEETMCDYRTQEWRAVETQTDKGKGVVTHWPQVETGRLDRLRYAADYRVTISYEDGGPETYTLTPGDTSFLGMNKTLTRAQADKAERAYKAWKPGETVTLTINNLGGVHSVEHGGIELAAQ